MTIKQSLLNAESEQVDSAAVTRILRDLSDPAPERNDGERFLVADPDDPVAHVFELPPDGPLRYVETIPTERRNAVDWNDDERPAGG